MKTGQLLPPGDSTAFGETVTYRLAKVGRVTPIAGRWLDCGCADGAYSEGLLSLGAREVVGTDVSEERVEAAREKWRDTRGLSFVAAPAEDMAFPDASFDGAFLNEVLEHVRDERQTLLELRRVLVPGGHLFVFSPNRWFPFEGHGATIGRLELGFPVPLLPWLPMRLVEPTLRARNWWPGQLRDLVAAAGFEIVAVDFALPQFGRYPWMPEPLLRAYEQRFQSLERRRWVRRFGVSTFIAARKPAASE
jgi:ubiquinone/menaquinone biosynthesis C-methylase UbiE